jgi:hypothetical protein
MPGLAAAGGPRVKGAASMPQETSDRTVTVPAACPRCGSTRVQARPIIYADGPVPANLCLECGYLDLQQLPTYISPRSTTKVDDYRRRLPDGTALGIARQAGVIDDEGSTGTTATAIPENT